MKGLFGSHIQLTGTVMNLQLERQNLVMANIANVNTPGYKGRTLEFEGKLQSALNQDARGKMTRTNKSHMPVVFNPNGFQGDSLTNFSAREVHGKDSVDLDKEMATMTKNGMMYSALATVIKKNMSGLQKVIQDGAK